MNIPDARDEVRIWQRVRGESTPATDGLPGLTAGAMAQAALYGVLARQISGPGRTILLQLQEDELAHIRCLKGIYRMAFGMGMNTACVPPAPEKTESALRKCYGTALKALNAYEARSGNGEYGAVFGMLAAKKREHCYKLAQVMGILGV